jgi:hypothetical protein
MPGSRYPCAKYATCWGCPPPACPNARFGVSAIGGDANDFAVSAVLADGSRTLTHLRQCGLLNS